MFMSCVADAIFKINASVRFFTCSFPEHSMAHPEEMYEGASAFPTDKLIGYFDLLHA